MFRNTKAKLEDTRCILEKLKEAEDALSFRSQFNAFLNSVRAITYALQKDGKSINGFNNWYEKKQLEMKGDELLRFIHKARTDDFHEGKHHLSFKTEVEKFQASTSEAPFPGAMIQPSAEGLFWLIDRGTPQERRIPIKQGGKYIVKISILNPPLAHLGIKIGNNNPVAICQLALDYFSKLVYEATTKFIK